MPLRPGRAIAASFAAALLAGGGAAAGADAAEKGPGPAPVPLVPLHSTQEPVPEGPGPDESVREPTMPELRSPAELAAGAPVRVERAPAHRTWLDEGHALVGSLLGTVLRIDRFFSDERDLDVQREQSFLRWRNDVRVASDDRTLRYRTSLLADLKFPGLNRWLERARLVIAGASEDTATSLREGPSGSEGSAASPVGSVGRAAAELQYALFENFRVKADLGAGVLFQLPPGAVGRLRFRYAEPFADVYLLRLAAVTFLRTDLGIGELVQGDLERRLAEDALVRLSGGATANHRQRDLGLQWGSELALIHALRPRSAISVGGGLDGITVPAARVNTYRAYARLRHDVFRQWIFVELEPELSWPFDPLERRSTVFAFTVRLEAQFQEDGVRLWRRDARRAPAQPQPADPEPADPEPKDPE